MADPLTALSTVANVMSLADVTIRACEGIYGLVASLRNAPRAVKSLRQTVEGIESTLRNLKTFMKEYESSVPFRKHHQFLPESINANIVSIRDDLRLLEGFLTSAGEAKKFRKRAKWAVQKKGFMEIVQRLERQQVALILSLQTVAQRSSIARHHDMFQIETNLKQSQANSTEEVLNALKPISRHLEVIARNEASASMGHASLSTSVGALRLASLAPKSNTDNEIDSLFSDPSPAPYLEDSIRSEFLVPPSTSDTLARIFRTELKQVIIPIVEERLDSYKSASEAQIVAIRENINSVAKEYHYSLQGVFRQDGNKVSRDVGPEKAGFGTKNQKHLQGSKTATFGIGKSSRTYEEAGYPRPLVVSDERLWIRTWCFRWRVGSLHVTTSACEMDNGDLKVSNTGHISQTSKRRMAYRVLITFIPAQNFLTSRGISVGFRSQQDQRGYHEISPLISSFAVIPKGSIVFFFSHTDNVEGINQLFSNGAGSPTDRDENGWTPLHEAAATGNHKICKFLLAQGADPLAIASFKHFNGNALEWTARVFGPLSATRSANSKDDYCTVATLLRNAGCDLNDETPCITRSIEPVQSARFQEWAYKISEEGSNLKRESPDELVTFLRCQVLKKDNVVADELAQELMHRLAMRHNVKIPNLAELQLIYRIYTVCAAWVLMSEQEMRPGYSLSTRFSYILDQMRNLH